MTLKREFTNFSYSVFNFCQLFVYTSYLLFLGGSPSKTPVNVTDVTPEHHPPGSIRRTSSVASDKDKTFEDLVKKVESSPHSAATTPAQQPSVQQHPPVNKKATRSTTSEAEADLDTSQQSMSDPDKSDYDDTRGGVDYDQSDFEDEYMPRGGRGRPTRQTRQKGRGRGRPNNNKPGSNLIKARPFAGAAKPTRGRSRKAVTIDTKGLEKVHRYF